MIETNAANQQRVAPVPGITTRSGNHCTSCKMHQHLLPQAHQPHMLRMGHLLLLLLLLPVDPNCCTPLSHRASEHMLQPKLPLCIRVNIYKTRAHIQQYKGFSLLSFQRCGGVEKHQFWGVGVCPSCCCCCCHKAAASKLRRM